MTYARTAEMTTIKSANTAKAHSRSFSRYIQEEQRNTQTLNKRTKHINKVKKSVKIQHALLFRHKPCLTEVFLGVISLTSSYFMGLVIHRRVTACFRDQLAYVHHLKRRPGTHLSAGFACSLNNNSCSRSDCLREHTRVYLLDKPHVQQSMRHKEVSIAPKHNYQCLAITQRDANSFEEASGAVRICFMF